MATKSPTVIVRGSTPRRFRSFDRRPAPRRARPLALERLEGRLLLSSVEQPLADAEPLEIPAVLAADSYDVRQNDDARTLPVLANDQVPEDYSGERVLSAVSYGSQGGTVEITEDGLGVIYAPPADFAGTETFTYFVGDQFATVTVEVEAVARDDRYSAFGGGRPLVLNVLDNDPFGRQYAGRRVVTGVSETTLGGTVEVAADGRSVTYTPPEAADDGDVDAFVYVVDDRYPAQVSIELSSPLQDDEFSTLLIDSTSVLDVLRNDRRTGSGLPLKRITHLFASQLRGTATISDDGQSIIYTPAPGFDGYDWFRYVVDNVHEAEVEVWVNRPVEDDWFSTHAGARRVLDVLENDVFDDPLDDGDRGPIDVVDRVTSVSATAKGGRAVIVDGGRAVEYTPPAGFWGEDTFEHVADDRYTARVTVTVPRPVVDDWFPLDANSTAARLDVVANDVSQYWEWRAGRGDYSTSDVIERVSSVGESEQGGLLTISEDGQAILYTPPRGFVGVDSFSYVADGAFEARVTVNLSNPVRDDSYEVRRDASETFLAVLANDFYGNGYTGARIVTGVDATDTAGRVEPAPDGTGVYYTPPRGFVGTDRFTYTVDGGLVATVYVSVTPRAILSPDWIGVCAGEADVSLDVLANDPRLEARPGETIITGVSDPGPGASVRVARDGDSLVFSSRGLAAPSYSFSYTVFGEFTTTVTVGIQHSVYASWDTAVVDQNSMQQSIDVLANDWFGHS